MDISNFVTNSPKGLKPFIKHKLSATAIVRKLTLLFNILEHFQQPKNDILIQMFGIHAKITQSVNYIKLAIFQYFGLGPNKSIPIVLSKAMPLK